LLGAIQPLRAFIGASRLEAGIQSLVSALNLARSETLQNARPVYLCGMRMRRHGVFDGCRAAAADGGNPWRQGWLLYADLPKGTQTQYDSREDLRVASFSSSLSVHSARAQYALPGQMPRFVLREELSQRCAVVWIDADTAWPRVCRDALCHPGCG